MHGGAIFDITEWKVLFTMAFLPISLSWEKAHLDGTNFCYMDKTVRKLIVPFAKRNTGDRVSERYNICEGMKV